MRHENWEEEFHAYLKANKKTPFSWGDNDCSSGAANIIRSFTDMDLAESFRGKYTDEESAFALIKELTGGETAADAIAFAAEQHGLVEHKHPFMAKRGDLVVIKNKDRLIGGVVSPTGAHAISVNDHGLVHLHITDIVRSWSV